MDTASPQGWLRYAMPPIVIALAFRLRSMHRERLRAHRLLHEARGA